VSPSIALRIALGLGVVCIAPGCGLGVVESQSGGADHLPTQGAGPYGKLGLDLETAADEPYVVSAFRVHVRDPSALRRQDGGVRLWFGYETALDGTESAIWHAELPDITELPDVPPEPALVADEPWEQGWVGAPSVIERSGGALVMFYQGGVNALAIGRADSNDDGRTWQKHASNPVVSNAAEPALALDPGGTWLLYLTRPGQAGIFRAESAEGLNFTLGDQAVLLPRPEQAEAYDRYGVSDPALVVRVSAAGRPHYGMFFNGAGEDGVVSIGWAGSFDGIEWHRFASPDEPVLVESGDTSEHGPTALLEADQGFLFFHEERQGVQRIAVAVHP
jgi:hypothetical protein